MFLKIYQYFIKEKYLVGTIVLRQYWIFITMLKLFLMLIWFLILGSKINAVSTNGMSLRIYSKNIKLKQVHKNSCKWTKKWRGNVCLLWRLFFQRNRAVLEIRPDTKYRLSKFSSLMINLLFAFLTGIKYLLFFYSALYL